MTSDELKDYIARLEAEFSNVATKYRGVRPSWVSTDLALLRDRIDRYKRMLSELEVGQ